MEEQALATILLRDTSLTRDRLEAALELQQGSGGSLVDILKEDRILPEDELLRAQAMYWGMEFLSQLKRARILILISIWTLLPSN